MTLLLPLFAFVVVFAGVQVVNRRMQRTMAHIDRHQIAGPVAAPPRDEKSILDMGKSTGAVSRLASRLTGGEVRSKAEKLLLEAGSPMPVATYLLIRMVFIFVLAPFFVYFVLTQYSLSMLSVLLTVVGVFTITNAPSVRIKRKARARARDIEHSMPDALDLLVVCAEGGLSLDGGLQQVSRRIEGPLASELQRLLNEIGSGKGRRDALISLGGRSQSESLKIFCTTIIQADKMGMSVGDTLRTLAETMRTRRRQSAETQARKAPIKMLPFLVFFMIPSLFIVILSPAALSVVHIFGGK